MDLKQYREYWNTKPVEFVIREKYELKEDRAYVPRFNLKSVTKIADIPINEPIKPTEEVLIKAIKYGMVFLINYKGAKDKHFAGHERIIYPMVLGKSMKGKDLVRGFHLNGWSVSSNRHITKIWRMFRLDRVLSITFTGGAPNETYDYYYQSNTGIGTVPTSGWSGTSTGRTDAVLSAAGTKSLPFHGIGLFPANYRLWVKFLGSQNLRYKDFTVTQTGGRVEYATLSTQTWSNGSGAGDTSTATTISVNDLNINETVDITIVTRYYTYTSGFFSNHSTWGWRNYALNNAGTTYSTVTTKGFIYTAGATAPGDWVLWVYFQSTGHYRAYDITVT
jgi:hypothetical protein